MLFIMPWQTSCGWQVFTKAISTSSSTKVSSHPGLSGTEGFPGSSPFLKAGTISILLKSCSRSSINACQFNQLVIWESQQARLKQLPIFCQWQQSWLLCFKIMELCSQCNICLTIASCFISCILNPSAQNQTIILFCDFD